MTKTEWKLITRLPGEHRIFADESGRLAIADNSGETPDQTEDGVLYLDFARPAVLTGDLTRDAHCRMEMYCWIPLLTARGKETHTMGRPEDGPILEGLGMRLEVKDTVKDKLQKLLPWMKAAGLGDAGPTATTEGGQP